MKDSLDRTAPLAGQAWRWPAGLLLGFGVIFAAISLVNHYYFRTAALDLGINTHALRDFGRGRMHLSTLLLDTPPTNFLSSHFALIPVLVSPLYWVFGSWTLLLVQLVALLLGGLGVWTYARGQGLAPRHANLALAYCLSLWGVYSALSFDYHDNVIGAMTIPWLVHWVAKRRWWPAALMFGLLLVSKENLALWGAVVLLGLAWKHRRERRVALVALAGVVLALAYFAVITKLVMPAIDTTHRPYTQMARYQHLGGSLPEIARNLLTQPTLLVAVLLRNTAGDPASNYIKLELWGVLLFSGGLLTLARPWYALMLGPLLAQKLLANDYGFWGINGQYSIEFVPVLALAAIDTAGYLAPRLRQRLLTATLALATLTTVVTLYTRYSIWYDRTTANFLQAKHYRSPLNVPRLHAALARVPADVPLSAQTNLAPWLTNRDSLYHYPVLRAARLVALLKRPFSAWPLTEEGYQDSLQALRHRTGMRVIYEDDQLLLLSRIPPGSLATSRP